jgi:hypothetical protein
LLRSLVCDTAATPFLLIEGVDFASHGEDDGAVRCWLDGVAEAMGVVVAHTVPFREQGALVARCASALDATTLRSLLHGRAAHRMPLRIEFMAAMPDAAEVHAAAEAKAEAATVAERDGAEDSFRLKTSLCRFWRTLGTCHHGASCRFAHGAEELCTRAPLLFAATSVAGFNPHAPEFLPPGAAAASASSGCWFNAQVVPVTTAELQQCCSAAWFSLPMDALAMGGPHGGLRLGHGFATALFLLDVDTGALHGLYYALEVTYDSVAPFACFACRTPPGQPLLMQDVALSMPQLGAAWHGAVALSGEDAARIDAWMSSPDCEGEEEVWSDPLALSLPPDLEERPPSVEPAAVDDPLADDTYAVMVAQHEADEAMAMALQAAEDEAARVAAAAPPSFASVAQRRVVAAAQPVAAPLAMPLAIPDASDTDNNYVRATLAELYPFLFPDGAPAESPAGVPPY